jgi:hypothetical protein
MQLTSNEMPMPEKLIWAFRPLLKTCHYQQPPLVKLKKINFNIFGNYLKPFLLWYRTEMPDAEMPVPVVCG